MLANVIISRLTPALLTVCVVFGLGNVPQGNTQGTLPAMPAADAPIIDYQNRYLPTYGRKGMVVSPEKLAGEIGLDTGQAILICKFYNQITSNAR